MPRTLLSLMLFLLFTGNIASGTEISATFKYQEQNSTLIAYSGEVQLPFEGNWRIADSETPSQVREAYLNRDFKSLRESYPEFMKSKRELYQEKEQKIRAGSSLMLTLYYSLKGYAEQHEFVGPNSLGDLDPVKDKKVIELNQKNWTRSYDTPLTGDFAFLFPGVAFSPDKTPGRRLPRSEKKGLMLELRPYVDDGEALDSLR